MTGNVTGAQAVSIQDYPRARPFYSPWTPNPGQIRSGQIDMRVRARMLKMTASGLGNREDRKRSDHYYYRTNQQPCRRKCYILKGRKRRASVVTCCGGKRCGVKGMRHPKTMSHGVGGVWRGVNHGGCGRGQTASSAARKRASETRVYRNVEAIERCPRACCTRRRLPVRSKSRTASV